MSHWKALIGGEPVQQREHWPEPVKTNGHALDAKPLRHIAPLPPLLNLELTPPMDERCKCGLHYGAHRVRDYACPNQQWRPGNGQPQWLAKQVFQRGTAASQER